MSLVTSIVSTEVTKRLRFVLTTFDTLTAPADYIQARKVQILDEINAPPLASLSAYLVSYSILSNGQRSYLLEAIVNWTV